MRYLLVIVLLTLAPACSVTTPRDVGNAHKITLEAIDASATKRATRKATLQVEYPTVAAELDTFRIAVTKNDGSTGYYDGVRWSEFLPAIVQSSLVESISRSRVYSFVQSDERRGSGNYVLHTVIEDFRAVYSTDAKPPIVSIRMAFKIANRADKKSIREFSIDKAAVARDNSLSAIAAAFNSAFSDVLRNAIHKL